MISHLRLLSSLGAVHMGIAALGVGTLACRTASESRGAAHPTSTIQSALRQAPTVDPTGQYELSFTDDGRVRGATMLIEGTPGAYRGRINAENRPEVAISALAASGPQVIVTGDIPQGMLVLRFRMAGDSVRGDWALRAEGGRLSGIRRRVTSK